MEFKAKTVYECWQIARDEAERCQEEMNDALHNGDNAKYKNNYIGRYIADKIALRILHGELHDKS